MLKCLLLWVILTSPASRCVTVLGQIRNVTHNYTLPLTTETDNSSEASQTTDITTLRTSSTTVFPGTHNPANTTTLQKRPFKTQYCEVWHPEQEFIKTCCYYISWNFQRKWYAGGYYLTQYMDSLRRWKCDDYRKECKSRTYAFNEYTTLVYDRFCNSTVLISKCLQQVKDVSEKYGFRNKSANKQSGNWTLVINSFRPSSMKLNDLIRPCVQIALFDRKDGGIGRFHEIVEPYLPFCDMIWTGYDIDTAMNRGVAPWTSLPIRCRAGIVICLMIMVLGSVVTIMANVTVLGVFIKVKKLRNSQGIYKMTLGVADLLVGLLVWPSMVVLQIWLFLNPRRMGNIIPSLTNTTAKGMSLIYQDLGDLERRYPGGYYNTIVSKPYISFLGFVTTLSLVVSVYTLMTASFDRFWAIFRPLKYNKYNAKRNSKVLSSVISILALVLSILPLFIHSIKYGLISSIFVSSDGTNALALLSVGIFVPLVVVWVLTLMTYRSSKKHAQNRQRLVSGRNESEALERRLAKTLAIMVGMFSVSVVPAFFCMLSGFFLTNTLYKDPKNLDTTAAVLYTSFEYVAIILLTTNSTWNVFIYSLRTNRFKIVMIATYKDIYKKSCLSAIGRGMRNVANNARRVSLSSLYTTKRTESESNSDSRKKSVSSLTTGVTKVTENSECRNSEPSFASSTVILDSTTTDKTPTAIYTKNKAVNKNVLHGAEKRVEQKKKKGEEEDGDLDHETSFGSYAVDAGANRLFESVMENIDTKDETKQSTSKG